jgi:hypothetical protein
MFYNSANGSQISSVVDSYDLRGILGHRLEMVADDVMSDSAAIFVPRHFLAVTTRVIYAQLTKQVTLQPLQ